MVISVYLTLSLYSSHREEYGKLFDFVNAKKLNIKNRGFKEVTIAPHARHDMSDIVHRLCQILMRVALLLCVCPCIPVEEGAYGSRASRVD